MKMHKILFLAVAALLLVMPPLNAQDEDGAESGGSTESEPGEEEKAAEPGAKAEDKGKGAEAAEKKTIFSEYQRKIKVLRDKKAKLEKSGRRREVGRALDALKTEQRKLKSLFEKEAARIRTEILHLKEQLRKTRPDMKDKLEADLKNYEDQLKTLETDADLANWCSELSEAPSDKDKDKNKSSEPGSKSKSRKKKISKKKKKK